MRLNLSILLTLCVLTAAGAQRELNFYHLGSKTGLSQVTINGLYQDENGILWIGTKDGVKYYDGNKVEPLNLPELNNWIASSFVPTLCGDGQGRLFINTDFNIIEYDLRRNTSKVVFSQSDTSSPPAVAFRYGHGALWIGMKDSLFVYRRDSLRFFAALPEPSCEISSLLPGTGQVYAGTKNHGLYRIDERGEATRLLHAGSEIISICMDNESNLWCGTFNDGVYRIFASGETDNLRKGTSQGSLSSNYIRTFCQDSQGDMWVGTSNGLNIVHRKDGTVSRYGLSEHGKKGLSNLSIWGILRDYQGTMWLGTYYGGLDYCNFDTDRFEHYDFGFNSGNGYSVISNIAEDVRGDFWLATESNGLLFMDSRTKECKFMQESPVSHYNIKTLHYDPERDLLWIGTHQGGVYSYDMRRKHFRHYSIDPNDKTTRSESVLSIAAYANGLFIGTLQGVYYLNFTDESILPVDQLRPYIFEANHILAGSAGDVWIAGNNFCRYDPRTGIVREFGSELQPITSGRKLSSTTLYEDASGNICIGTAGFGLLVLNTSTGEFRQYNKRNSHLSGDYVGSIFQTQDGNLLVGTNTGLSYLDKENMRCYNFSSDNGFPLHSMLPGCIHKKPGTEQIILGGINGMAITSEQKILSKDLPFRLYLSALYVNNRLVGVGDQTGILNEAFLFTKRISLKYRQNNIAIELGNNNLANFGQPLYQYKLDGFDKEWITYSPHAPVRYMNLPYGKYVFRTRTELAGHRREQEIALEIRVRPPLYATWYAYTFYVAFVVGMIVWTIYFYRSRLLLRTSLELERRDKEHKQAVNQNKIRFFGNISHELRTPLTLVMGQLELLLMSEQLPDTLHRKISEIYGDSRKMGALINELLDFMKFDQGEFRLKVSHSDIVEFVSGIHASFSALAELKKINLEFHTQIDHLKIWFDPVQMQKVFNNLLSNAFKYTPEGGRIAISIERPHDGSVCIRVQDSGIGIPRDMQEKIFERFFQVDNKINHDISQTGTGIGLSLTRHILHAHHGAIGVQSAKGAGSTFSLTLRSDESLFDNDPRVDIDRDTPQTVPEQIDSEQRQFLEQIAVSQSKDSGQANSMLIVEDDAVLRKMLMQIFEPIYTLHEAANGEQGLEQALKHSPDIILSDVMMPLMSGDEFCRRIKDNFDTCHIPVVLLTALDGVEHNIRGLNCGADDYITKPFNVKLLVTRCVALLNNRRLMQRKFSGQEDSTPVMVATNRMDLEFMERVMKITEEHIAQGSINVSMLCSQMAMSRTKLFNKIKGITGQAPHDFIQSAKLKTAARMLREQAEANVSDIAYTLGFSSLNYFGKCFRTTFGVSASAYRKSFQNTSNTSDHENRSDNDPADDADSDEQHG